MKPATSVRTLIVLAVMSLGILCGIEGSTAAQKNDGWLSLFNGKDLEGWVQRGGKAKYRVEDGQIVGTAVPASDNFFLCTKRDFADFILELEFKVDPKVNSGVQIRSHSYDEPKTYQFNGKSYKIPAGRVFGYQIEIDPSDRAWSGGFYEEGRRGWLQDLTKNDAARKAFKKNDWNHFRIECKGDSFKTWINGVAAADAKDSVDASGFIALQVHGAPKDAPKQEVRFRNLKLKELK